MEYMDAPVFIIGGSRTGSELLKNIIYLNTDIDLVPEMWLMSPFWIHRDFFSLAKVDGALTIGGKKLEELIDLVFSKKCKAAFWQNIEDMGMDKDELRNDFILSGRKLGDFVRLILVQRARARNKRVIGAKFPVHFSYVDKLLEWFPDAKIIHTIRDPRASYASQLVKHRKNKTTVFRKVISAVMQLFHILFQFKWQVKVDEKLSMRQNYFLYKYEDFVKAPEEKLNELCEFLNVEYKNSMLSPTITNSSHSNNNDCKEIRKDSLMAWKDVLSPTVVRIIEVLAKKDMEKLGYL